VKIWPLLLQSAFALARETFNLASRFKNININYKGILPDAFY
jgi:cytochrome c-type biogenesis protein CcmE